MRFDCLSIFPEYFSVLHLSLMGKAAESGIVSFHVHDVRSVAQDRHRTVDDTPYGGGAGMVMRADIWGKIIDPLLEETVETQVAPQMSSGESEQRDVRRILAIPTPSGVPLTQEIVRDLARADHIIIACGRYEGIDSRVAVHYEERGVEVREFSIGDYVLNGGEVAALVLMESVCRLLDGFMGNPHSLDEESYEGGLLEYPVYTKPRMWRDLEVPEVLLSGNHARIEQWREGESIDKTAARRPDLLTRVDPFSLRTATKERLVERGYAVRRQGEVHAVRLRVAECTDAGKLSELAARTFPLACPENLPKSAIDAFIEAELSPDSFRTMLEDPAHHRILLAQVGQELVGYTLCILAGRWDNPKGLGRSGVIDPCAAYMSKCYVDQQWQGSGVAGALLEAAVKDLLALPKEVRPPQLVLGTNEANKRAQHFYKRHGFRKGGKRRFIVGGVENRDVVLVRDLTLLET